MKTEEKILDYMDGTLSESESGELLHSLSVSPEKRVVLEQHIKLRELTSLAQKPLAIPQALEASMAERFPAIASYNRELSGGALLIEQASHPSYIGRMAAAVAAFIGQYPIRTGFAVAAASVIAYFALSGSEKSIVDSRLSIVGKNSMVSAPSTNSSSDVQKGNSISSTDNIQPTTSQSNSSSKIFSSKQFHNRVQSNAVASSGKDFSPSVKNNAPIKVRSSNSNTEHITPAHHDITPPVEIQKSNKNIVDAKNTINAVTPPQNISSEKTNTENTNAVKDYASITPVTNIRSQDNIVLAENNVHGNRYEQNPFRDKDENSGGFPFVLRLYYGLGQSFINVHQADATLANRTEATPLIGIDYIASPQISLGIEGGSAAISQLLTQSAIQSNINGLPSISRVVVSNVVTNGTQWYSRAVVRYTFNPYDMIHLEGTAGAGVAFGSTAAPLVSAAIFAVHDLSDHFGVSLGVAFAGAWTNANAQNAAVQSVASGNDPVGFITVNHATATLFTPSYAVRFGIKLRP